MPVESLDYLNEINVERVYMIYIYGEVLQYGRVNNLHLSTPVGSHLPHTIAER